MKEVIIFVCNGNIYRSVIAAQRLRDILKKKRPSSNFVVSSYGLQGTMGTHLPKHRRLSEYPKEWKVAEPILRKLNINISGHSFKRMTARAAKEASIMVAMDDRCYSRAKNSLIKQFPTQAYKIHSFSELTRGYKSIDDPVGSNNANLHKRIIRTICVVLDKRYKDILAWGLESRRMTSR